MDKLLEPLVQTLAHLARGFFGEGNGQDFLRAQLPGGRLKQRPHDARHQHPGFTGTCTGLYGHAATRVTGNGVEGFSGDGLAVALVSGFHAWASERYKHCRRSFKWPPQEKSRLSVGGELRKRDDGARGNKGEDIIFSKNLCGTSHGRCSNRRLCPRPAQAAPHHRRCGTCR